MRTVAEIERELFGVAQELGVARVNFLVQERRFMERVTSLDKELKDARDEEAKAAPAELARRIDLLSRELAAVRAAVVE